MRGVCLTCQALAIAAEPPSGLSNEKPITNENPISANGNGAVVVLDPPSAEDVREVLDTTHDFLRRFLVMSDDGLRVLSLWIFHTWAFAASETTPYISIRSPERESGKTRVIEVVSPLAREAEQVADASISALFRSIEKYRSTMLFDEVDGIFRGRDEDSKDLKRLLNRGTAPGQRSYKDGRRPARAEAVQHVQPEAARRPRRPARSRASSLAACRS